MAVRNPRVLPIAALIVIGILALAILGGAAIALNSGSRPEPTSILRVPGNYGTIQEAINAASSGDTVEVAAGTYKGNIMLDKVISLTANSFDRANGANNTAILDGGDGEATILIPGGLADMSSIHGFVIRGGQDGIDAHSRFIAEYNYFYGSQLSVEYETGSGGVNRNNVYFNSADDAVHVDDMAAPLLIQSNRFMYAGDDAIEIDLQGTSTPASSVELDIWDNLILGSSQDGIKFVDYATNPRDVDRHIVIAGNLIANNRRAAIGFMHGGNTNEDYSATDAAESVRIYNDTLYGNDYGISGGDNVVAFNNIIANTTSRGAWRVQGPPGGNSVIAYTLFWNNRVDTDQSLLGPGNIVGQDPRFLSAPSPGADGEWGTVDDDYGGLLPGQGSAAIDQGIAQYKAASGEAVPPAPLTGFIGAAPDLGWREFGSPIFMTPTAMGAAPNPGLGETLVAVATTTGIPATTMTPAVPEETGTPGSPTAGATGGPQATGGPLILQSISPARVTATTNVVVTVTGSGFEQGAAVSFEGLHELPPQVLSVEVLDANTLTVTLNPNDDDGDTDVWDVRVTNPDGTTGRLLGAFTITH